MIAGLLLAACSGGPAAPHEDTVPLVVATRDLAPGQVVGSDDLEVTQVPRAMFPPSGLADRKEVLGQVVQAGIWAHQPFVAARLDPARAFTLKAGMTETRLALPALVPLLQHGDVLDVVRKGPKPCVVAADLYVVGTRDPEMVRVAGPANALTALRAASSDEQVVLIRGFDTVAPPLPACTEAP